MEPPVPQEPASTAARKPNVPGKPPMHRPWYASPVVFVGLILLFFAALLYVSRQLGTTREGRAETVHGADSAATTPAPTGAAPADTAMPARVLRDSAAR